MPGGYGDGSYGSGTYGDPLAAVPRPVRPLADLARELLDDQPSWFREAPDNQAVLTCYANESDRIRGLAEQVRDNLIPARTDSMGLPWWEQLARFTQEPVGLSEDERRERILTVVLMTTLGVAGHRWEEAVTLLIGAGWTYEEDSPYEIQITAPWGPGSPNFDLVETWVRYFTPAHLDLTINAGTGFALDSSQLDQDPFHPS